MTRANSKPVISWAGLVLAAFLFHGPARGGEPYTGRYVLVQQTTSTTKLPVLKDVVASTTAISVVDLEHESSRLKGTGTLCSLELSSNSSLVETSFPAAFIRALPDISLDASLEVRDGRNYLVSDAQTLVLGARLTHPRSEHLPSDSKDRRVYDQDGDGKPGMTVVVSGLVSGEVYVVQRSTTQFHGPEGPNGFSGGIHFELEQHVIGASKSVLRSGPAPRADSSRSWFQLMRVPETADCDEAVRLQTARR